MLVNIRFVDKDGNCYGILNEVDDTASLLNVRTRASSVLKSLPVNYLFTWIDTPVSQKQENVFKVCRCAKLIPDRPGFFDLVIYVKETREQTDRSGQLTSKYKTDQDPRLVANITTAEQSEKTKQGLNIYTKEEIERDNISKLERERRIFWNNLACEISNPVYKSWNLHAVVGLIDTEWTLRKSELLKLEASYLLKKIQEKTYKILSNKKQVKKKRNFFKFRSFIKA